MILSSTFGGLLVSSFKKYRNRALSGMLAVAVLDGALFMAPGVAEAQSAAAYAIPAGSLAEALTDYIEASGVALVYDASLARGRTSPGLRGSFEPAEALSRLLADTGLTFRQTGPRAFTLEQAPRPAPGAIELGPVRIDGQGAKTTGPAIPPTGMIGTLPPPYAGGQVARGARLGGLGNVDLFSTPFNITSFTAELIQDQQARGLSEVLYNDPSVRPYDSAGGWTEGNAFIRGFAQNIGSTLFNGVFGLLPNYVPMEIAERVEVLKGPSAMLNGLTPVGGIGGNVNVVAKRAGDAPLTRVSAQYLSDGVIGGDVDVGRRFGADGAFGVRANLAYSAGDTAIDHQEQKSRFASIALDYQGDGVRASVDAFHQKYQMDGVFRSSFSFIGPVIPAPPKSHIAPIHGGGFTLEGWGIVGRLEVDLLPDWTVHAVAAKSVAKNGSTSFTLTTQVDSDGNFRGRPGAGWTGPKRDHQEIGLTGSFTTGPIAHRLSITGARMNRIGLSSGGTTGVNVPGNIYRSIYATVTPLPAVRYKSNQGTTQGIAIVDSLSYGDVLTLIAGVRYQEVNNKNFNPNGTLRSTPYKEHALTPMGGFVVKPFGKAVSLYANYVQGLEDGANVTDVTAPNFGESFPPYKAEQFEAGVKWDGGDIGVTTAIFQISQPSLLQDPFTRRYEADGRQRNRGVELSIFGQPTPQLRIQGGASYIDAILVRTPSGANDGNRAPGVGKVQASLGVDWSIKQVPGFALNGRYIYSSSAFINPANSQRVDGWTKVDLGARYRMAIAGRPVVWRITVENALGHDYWLASNFGSATQSAPRTFVLSGAIDL
ncbi:TonB-dependent receptor [Sphingobium chlorophenolicum]|uniref:TonB-dependent siderophore receptor n=1 Tax=Sphingobium chlorophenolicum TaxID=46429 RepID=A0A081RA91_SPHCR|nr:TonB-dependent receptor [Sphingobium chlorophenolicum]KEQ52114.1 TonB-dependent siderophore receptor [Sphingobium chlorophenolicum]